MLKLNNQKVIKIIVFLFTFLEYLQSLDATLTSTNTTATATTNHILTISGFEEYIQAGSFVWFQYSSAWDLTPAVGYDSTSDYCSTGCTLSSGALAISGQTVRINNLFPTKVALSTYGIQFTIKNLVNPNRALSLSMTIYVNRSTGVLQALSTVSIVIEASQMGCTVLPTNQTIQAITDYTFTITPAITFPSTGYVIVSFPSKWSDSAQSDVFQSPSCSNGAGSLACTLASASSLRVPGVLTASSSSAFTFNINGIRNPGSIGINQELSLSFFNAANEVMGRGIVTISNLLPQTMTGVSFTLNCNTNQETIGVLLLTIPSTSRLTDKMVLTFDPQVVVTPLTKVLIYIGTDNVPTNTQISIETQNSLKSSIAFYPYANEVINYFRIQLYNLKCPSTIKQTNDIKIEVIRMGTVIMMYQCCKITSTLPAFESASVIFEDYRMAQVTNYNFIIKINETIGLGTRFIDFTFPSTYGLVTGNTYSCFIQGYTDPSKTLCTVTSSTLISLSLLSTNLSTLLSTIKSPNITTSLQLTVTMMGLRNPSATSVTFSIYLSDSAHNYLQGKTGISQMLNAALISGVLITPGSYKVYDSSTYTFRVNNTNALGVGSILRIRFPTQIKLSSPVCKINGGVVLCNNITVNGRDIVQITLLNTAVAQYGLFGSQVITVDNVINRDSFEMTQSFQLQIQTSGVVIEGIYEGLSISMNQSNVFGPAPLSVSVLNNTVYEKTQYTIFYQLPFTIDPLKTYKLRVNLPSEYRIYSCIACTSFGEFTITSNSGSVKIDSVQNPFKTVISSAINFQLRVNEYLSLQDTKLLTTFTSIVQTFSVKFSNYIMGAKSTCWVQVDNIKPDMKEFRIQIPNQVTLGATYNVSCLQCEIVSFSKALNLITVKINKAEQDNITFEISNLTNPTLTPSSIFSVSTYTTDSVLISQSTTLSNYFSIICSSNCATCDTIDSTKCLTCYQSQYLRVATNVCVATCLTSQFLVGFKCYQCNSNCNTCINESQICTSCSGLYALFNNRCLLTCPQSFYAQGNICQTCSPPCLTCTNSATCTYCVSGKVLRTDSSCQSTCLAGSYNKSNICVSCPINCTSCTASGCTACSASNYLLNGNCLSVCPFGYFIDNTNLLCQACKFPCKYCSMKSTNCTGCDKASSNPCYHQNQCLGQCLPTYYADENFICRSCVSPCVNCNSATNCTSCQGSFKFYASTNQCFAVCPPNTIAVGSVCLACQSPCLECSGTVLNCTSCIQNYFLDSSINKCNATCNSPTVPINRLCSSCLQPCAQCNSGQPYSCISCIAGYNLLQNNCYQTCPSKTYANSGYCLPCTSGCYQCITTSSTCKSCFPGTYLYGTSCIPSCPTVPVYYYEYQSQCISCQAPCDTCLSSPVECETCKSSTDYWNPTTLRCVASCQVPYFSVIVSGRRQCKKCELPCKTCSSNYDKCSSCYNGRYLHLEDCIIECPGRYYPEQNACYSCPSLCATCTKTKCLTCNYGSYLYKELCYNTCPPEAAYSYGVYCRNCLKENCLLCNNNNECIMCEQSYYLFGGNCLKTCPSNHQPDSITKLACVKTSSSALFQFLQEKQKQKIFFFSGSILSIFLIGSVLVFPGSNIIGIYSIISIPESITTIIFSYFYFTHSKQDLTLGFTLPYFAVVIVLVVGVLFSVPYVLRSIKILLLDEEFFKCYHYGSNQKRTNLLLICSLINFKLFKLSFSGYLKLPFTSYQLQNHSLINYLNWLTLLWLILYNAPIIVLTLYVIIVQKSYLITNKIFFSAADCLLVHIFSSFFSIVYLLKNNQLPDIYKKHIIEGISELTLPPLSQPNDYIGNQEQDNAHLYHSNSVQDIKESKQMKDVEFLSVYDPSDFQDPPKLPPKQLQNAMKKGKFRTKQKPKKRGKGKYRLDELDVIDEQISEEQQNSKNQKRQSNNRNRKSSLVNNYIYWQPPKTKNRAEQVFKQNKREIMQNIYETQSQSDTITNNDIIFLEDSDEDNKEKNSMEDNFDEEVMTNNNDSKRELKPIAPKNRYNDLLNLNYAQRKHLS